MKIVSSLKIRSNFVLGAFVVSALFIGVSSSFGQLNNTFDNSSNSNRGLNANQLGNTNTGGPSSGNDPLDPGPLDVTSDPGGPTDPIDDLAVPLDGGITLLIAIGIASGYRKRK